MSLDRCFRYLRSFVPAFNATKEEKLHFVKYSQSENEKELCELANGSAAIAALKPQLSNGKDETSKEEEKSDQINEWQAAWNITNAIQGMFIVSFPYAVLQGGYWAILAIVFVSGICCYTGKILVECLYEENEAGEKIRIRKSYVEIAEYAFGKRFGGKLVNVAQIIELLMTCILYVLLCGDLIIGSFPNTPLDLTSWIMISTVFLLPCAFLQSLRSVSWLSFWCTVAHMIINAIVIIYCLTRVSEWKINDVQVKIDIWTFPISLGIVVFSYTSQIFVPSLEGKMINRQKFSCMMHWTHIAAAVFKATFAYIGFVMWGYQTKEVITNNLPTQGFKIVINSFLLIKALLSYPLPYYAAVDLLDTAFFSTQEKSVFPSCIDRTKKLKVWALALRLGLVLITMVLAIVIPHFAILMGLIGSFTGTMLSLVWPSYFHLYIKWRSLKWFSKALDIFVILLGFVVGIMGMYYSGRALILALNGFPTEPYHSNYPVHNRP